jgi:hypothetical protein
MSKPQISIPLDIDDVNVLKVEVSQNGSIHITLESSPNYGYCRKGGHKLTKFHGYDDWVKVQHMPILGQAVFLHYGSLDKSGVGPKYGGIRLLKVVRCAAMGS